MFKNVLLRRIVNIQFSNFSKIIEPNNKYEILGICRTSTKEEIKEAYFKLAKIHHPDISHATNLRQTNFLNIRNAYEEIIREKENKENYGLINEYQYSNNKSVNDIITNIFKTNFNLNNPSNNTQDENRYQNFSPFKPIHGIILDYRDIIEIKSFLKLSKQKEIKKENKRFRIKNQNEKININKNTIINELNLLITPRPDNEINYNDIKNQPIKEKMRISNESKFFLILTKFVSLFTIISFLILYIGWKGGIAGLYILFVALFN